MRTFKVIVIALLIFIVNASVASNPISSNRYSVTLIKPIDFNYMDSHQVLNPITISPTQQWFEFIGWLSILFDSRDGFCVLKLFPDDYAIDCECSSNYKCSGIGPNEFNHYIITIKAK